MCIVITNPLPNLRFCHGYVIGIWIFFSRISSHVPLNFKNPFLDVSRTLRIGGKTGKLVLDQVYFQSGNAVLACIIEPLHVV